jgi:hypothetical protein
VTGRIRPLLVYAALAALLFAPALAGGRIFSFRDLADFNLPHKLYGAAMLRLGSIPLWNPYNFCGYPHLANLQSGVLYPPNLLVVLLPFAIGFNLTVVLHFVIAALGARALARSLGIGAGGALVAGIAYGFSPLLVSMLDLLPPLAGAAWLPWALAAGISIGETPSPRRIAAGALVLGLAFLAAEPLYFGLALGMIPAAAIAGRGRGRGRTRGAIAALAAVAVALLLVAPVLLPFLELVAHSERAGAGLTREQALRDSLAPGGLLALVLPPRPGDGGTGEAGGQSYIRRPYLGLTVALLAAAGLFPGARREVAFRGFAVLAAVLGIVLALGSNGGLYPLLYDLGFRQSRFPMKFLVVTLLALALLAACGAEWVLARRPRLAAALAGLVALDLVLAARPIVTTGSAAALLAPGPTAGAIAALDPGAGAAAACVWPRVYPPPYTVETLRFIAPDGRSDDAAIGRKKALLVGNTNLYAGLASAAGGDSMEVRATTELLDAIARGPRARPLLDLTGAGWFVTTHDLGGLGFVERWAADGVRLYQNPQALPHAFLVGRVRAGTVFTPDFDPRREASVEDAAVAAIGDLSPACAEGSARVVSCAARAVAIETETAAGAGRCLLVLTDTYYPGWEAEVDGSRVEVIRADHAFRGVVVAAGKHQVRFAYRPRSFAIGLWLFAASLVALIALVALPVAPRRDRRGAARR